MQFDAIRRAPDEVRHRTYEFLHVATDFKPPISEEGKNAARAPRFPALQSGAQSLYNGVSALPGVGAILKSPAVAKRLQDVYHRFNSKAQKYAPLTAEERAKWEDYYAVVDGAAIFLPDRHELVETGVNQFADFLRVSFSARAVKPEISENRIVTSLRSSALATSAASFWAACCRSALIAESTTALPSSARCASNLAIAAARFSSSSCSDMVGYLGSDLL